MSLFRRKAHLERGNAFKSLRSLLQVPGSGDLVIAMNQGWLLCGETDFQVVGCKF